MRSTQSVLISLLLMAVLASCNSGTPAKSRRDTLTAQKERLVNELSDMITKFKLKEEGDETNVQKASKYKKAVSIELLSLCGILESKDAAEACLGATQDLGKKEFVPRFFDAKATMDDKEKILEQMRQGLSLKADAISETDLFCDKILDLMKVMKQIRELT